MSEFLENARALINRIAVGTPSDETMAADIAALKAGFEENARAVGENKISDDEVKAVFTELLEKLAASKAAE
jgi:hypothetical protein